MHGSQYVTNQLRGFQYTTSITNMRRMLVTKFFCSSHDEDLEVSWSQNPMVYKTQQLLEENEKLGETRSPVTLLHTYGTVFLCNCVSPLTALKIILIYVWGREKRKPKHIITDWMKNKLKNLSFIILDGYPIYRATRFRQL